MSGHETLTQAAAGYIAGDMSTLPTMTPEELRAVRAEMGDTLVNIYFKTIADLDKAVSDRCLALIEQPDMIRASTLFHWWPQPRKGK